jgi:hypothetical protein
MKKMMMAVLCLATIIILSEAPPSYAAGQPVKSNHTVKLKQARQPRIHNRLLLQAAKLGIDTKGLSDKDLKVKINGAQKAKRHEQLVSAASKLGIDTAGLSDKEIAGKIKAAKKK